MLPLLETLRPVAVEVVGLVVDEVELSVRQRAVARGTREATWMPVTVEGQQARVDERLHASGALRVVLLGEALHTVCVVVGGLEQKSLKNKF